MTVLEAIQRGTDFLARKQVDSPRLQAEWLLAHVLGEPRLRLYLQFDRQLTEPETSALRELVVRRGKREPLQHLLGTAVFCGIELEVNPSTLIPRPETERLAEAALAWLHTVPAEIPEVLDFGTGSGCIAIAIAQQHARASVHAIDLSREALAVAQRNLERHGLVGRVQLHPGDGFSALPASLTFDLIMANPPYIPTAEIETLQPEVREFDPRIALDGGIDGLRFYRLLAQEGRTRLRPHGRLFAEIGDGQADAVTALFRHDNWIVEPVIEDYSGRPRIVSARPPETGF